MEDTQRERSILRIAKRELRQLRDAFVSGLLYEPLIGTFARSDMNGTVVWTLVGLSVDSAEEARSTATACAPVRLVPCAVQDAFAREVGELLQAEGNGVAPALLFGVAEDGTLHLAGAVPLGEGWGSLDDCSLEGEASAQFWRDGVAPSLGELPPERVARFTSSFGIEAYQRLRRSTVAVIGAGGTGSVAIPTLARAGVGRIVIVDSDHLTPSNLERTQASFPEHVVAQLLKAELARDHVRRIDPDIEVIAFEGRLPQREVLEAVAQADVLVGCTDQHTSRLALSDVARRYLIPAIDCGGLIEGANGRVTGQIVQLVLFGPDDPCPRCRGMVTDLRVRQELLSPDERERMTREAAHRAVPPEAHEVPQIDTVGYITTISGTLAAAYAIGWLTGRFDPPFQRMQMNLIAEGLDVTDRPQRHDPTCGCRQVRGLGDLAAAAVPFPVPGHWKPARRLA